MKENLQGIIILFSIWLFLSLIIEKIFLPTPIEVFQKLLLLSISWEIYFDILQTLKRTLIGLLIGSILGIIIGIIIGYYNKFYRVLQFPVDFLRSIPATALFPLFIVIFGLGDKIKIFIAAWASSFVVLINTIYGIQSISKTKLMVLKLKKVSFCKKILSVILPHSLPYIVAGLRIGLSFALIVEIVAEMFLGSNSGLGNRIYNASTIFEMEEVYATILIIGLIGYLLNKIIIITEKRIIHWSGQT